MTKEDLLENLYENMYMKDDELLSACLTLLEVISPYQHLMAPEVAGAVARLEEVVEERTK
jgi:hypothetical protein